MIKLSKYHKAEDIVDQQSSNLEGTSVNSYYPAKPKKIQPEQPVKPTINKNLLTWFSNSVVKNADGTPKVVYHGTEKKFKRFNPRMVGTNLGTQAGFWFTDSPDAAEYYSNGVQPVMKIFLKITNPLVVSEEMYAKKAAEFWGPSRWAKLAFSNGHDGVIIQNVVDGDMRSTVYSVQSAEQIKVIS
jgi:hypothetical protein